MISINIMDHNIYQRLNQKNEKPSRRKQIKECRFWLNTTILSFGKRKLGIWEQSLYYLHMGDIHNMWKIFITV